MVAVCFSRMLTTNPAPARRTDPEYANMPDISQAEVLNALRAVKAPGGGDLVSAGLVSGIFIANGKVFFSINAPVDEAQAYEAVRS